MSRVLQSAASTASSALRSAAPRAAASSAAASSRSVPAQLSKMPASQSRRPISFVARATDFNKPDAGHVTALLEPVESAHVGKSGVSQVGWNGARPALSHPGLQKLDRKDTDKEFPAVHNKGEIQQGAPDKPFTHRADLPQINKKGGELIKKHIADHQASGTSYFTTEANAKIVGMRTQNCVGFSQALVRTLSGVNLKIHRNATPDEFVGTVQENRSVIAAGMKARGSTD